MGKLTKAAATVLGLLLVTQQGWAVDKGKDDGFHYTYKKWCGHVCKPDAMTLVIEPKRGWFRSYLISNCGRAGLLPFKDIILPGLAAGFAVFLWSETDPSLPSSVD